jgi:single-strand DNA-binding protein
MMKLELIGNLGKDCTVNEVNGSHVINFSVAHSEKVRDRDNNFVDKTRWVECAYWTDKTGVANFLRKGQQIYAEGFPDVKTYNKKDGTTGTSLTLRVMLLQLVGYSLPEGLSKLTDKEKDSANQAVVDDLPF